MPLDRGIVDQQLRALGEGTGWWDRRELRDLPAIMRADEEILAIAYGKVGRLRFLRRSWLVVLTDARLLCMRSSRRSWRQIEVGIDQITRLGLRVGPFRGRLIVRAGNESIRLLLQRPAAYKLLQTLRDIVTPAEELKRGFRPTRVVQRVVDHVLELPAVVFSPDANAGQQPVAPPKPQLAPPTDDYVYKLETEIDQLKQQVDFLEQLLRERQESR